MCAWYLASMPTTLEADEVLLQNATASSDTSSPAAVQTASDKLMPSLNKKAAEKKMEKEADAASPAVDISAADEAFVLSLRYRIGKKRLITATLRYWAEPPLTS